MIMNVTMRDIPTESINEYFRVKQELQKYEQNEDKNDSNQKNQEKDEANQDNVSDYGGNSYSKAEGNRKSKKDQTRNYLCGCGKSYLSYPALYTHIKTKHDGEVQVGTQNSAMSNNRRGRPRRNNDEPIMKNEETKEKRVDDMALVYQRLVTSEDLKMLEFMPQGSGVCDDFSSCFPMHQNSETGKSEYDELCAILKRIQAKTFREEITAESSVDSIFAVYLWCLCRFMNNRFYRVITIFFRAFRSCLNKDAYTFFEEFKKSTYNNTLMQVTLKRNAAGRLIQNSLAPSAQQQSNSKISSNNNNNNNGKIKDAAGVGSQTKLGQEGSSSNLQKISGKQSQQVAAQHNLFTQVETVQNLGIIAEHFLLKYLPVEVPSFEQNFAVYILMDFCAWLNRNGFSKIKIELQQSFMHDRSISESLALQDSHLFD